MNNFYSRKDISSKSIELKKKGKKVVFTNGCFDIIHRGHVEYLTQASELGDFLIVGLNTDMSVKRIKDEGRPINCEEDRAIVMGAFKCVDAVTFFDEDTPLELIKAIVPDVLAKGADYKIEEIVGHKEVLEAGGKVIPIPLTEGRSTTSLIDKIKKL